MTKEQADSMKELLSVSRVCEILELSKPTIYEFMKSGELPYVAFGRRRRIRREDLEALISRRMVARS